MIIIVLFTYFNIALLFITNIEHQNIIMHKNYGLTKIITKIMV